MDALTPKPEQQQLVPAVQTSEALATGEVFDCWNRIGVSGDGSCGELVRHVHCRNCPVYSAAGARLLERRPPDDYRKHWTEEFARKKKRVSQGKMSVVIFRIDAEWLALPTKAFQEVVEWRRVHSLPNRRNGALLGVINVRGELLVCISLGKLLGMEQSVTPDFSFDRFVVGEWQGNRVSFPVSEVHAVHRFHADEVKEAPATVARANPGFTRGLLSWQDRKVGCLDVETLFAAMNRSLS